MNGFIHKKREVPHIISKNYVTTILDVARWYRQEWKRQLPLDNAEGSIVSRLIRGEVKAQVVVSSKPACRLFVKGESVHGTFRLFWWTAGW